MASPKRERLSLESRGINSNSSEQQPAETPAPAAKRAPAKKKAEAKNGGAVTRETFTIPSYDYELIGEIKIACAKQGIPMNNSEIVRAGLIALAELKDKDLAKTASRVEKLKPGRAKTK